MTSLSNHLLIEFYDCSIDTLNSTNKLEELLKTAVTKCGATIVGSVFHKFEPQGASGVVVIQESHISVHTWPEYGYAAVDFFTCNLEMDYMIAFNYLREELGDNVRGEYKVVPRGEEVPKPVFPK